MNLQPMKTVRWWTAGFCVLAFGWVARTALGSDAAPIPDHFGLGLALDQGFSPHKIDGVTPYLFDVKLGPLYMHREWVFGAYGGIRYLGNLSRGGGGLTASLFIWDPDQRHSGFRAVLDGGYYSGNQRLIQTGLVGDLSRLIQVGGSIGIGNRPNDHLFFAVSVGSDLEHVWELFFPPPGPNDI